MDLMNEKLDSNIVEKLIKLGYKTIDRLLIETNPFAIAEMTDLSLEDVKRFYETISDIYVGKSCKIQPILAQTNKIASKLSTGCNVLDKKLGGGFHPGGLYEIFGECGSGKTQICLQISINIIYSNPTSYVCYICTDDAFPIERLVQLLEHRYRIPSNELFKYLDRLLIYHAVDLHQVCDGLTKIKRKLISFPIDLIVVDSIAGCARLTSENVPYTTRVRTKYFALFKRLFSDCVKLVNDLRNRQLTLISINQVVDNFVEGNKVGIGPCLGLSWSNILNTRIFLKRLYPIDTIQSSDLDLLIEEASKRSDSSIATPFEPIEGMPRILKVVFSNNLHLLPIHCLFTINQNGINGTNTVLELSPNS